MILLTPDECRVLGTMIEKALTVPGQYPITLNGLTSGCNQKSNRDPVTAMPEDRVFEALESLRSKGIAREVMMTGSRVAKFRHMVREELKVTTEELVILAELWLRGPQSAAELRSNASRMTPLGTAESMAALLTGLASRPEPYVRELARRPGERTTRFVQLICPDLHPLDGPVSGEPQNHASASSEVDGRIARLEQQIEELKLAVTKISQAVEQLG
jgi:uncharacterized protein YceH (UPF0502 family)